ncbi:CAP domain-containing protein [Nonomuraea sp. NPDC050153]|uniref:CAP domain-containing protein n=1 Tax=Nonomuraea sp. NPDC050153 TaxID=3364359 RepID=UPI0037B1A06E
MRGQLQALICLGSLAALSFPATAAQAATQAASAPACRVVAAKPVVTRGVVRGTATRTGCTDQARLRVRIQVVASGPDRVLKSGSKTVGTGRITAGVQCSPTPRSYYVVAVDSKGRSSRSRPVRLSCASGGGFASSVETEVVKLTNQARARKGCRPLLHDPRLHLAAERHSAEMGANNYFSHDSRDGRTFDQRIKAAGFSFSSAAENIAMGQLTGAAVMKGWLKSSGNRANILNCSFTHIGVGHNAKGPSWTQVFAAH